jgi:plastocyanin
MRIRSFGVGAVVLGVGACGGGGASSATGTGGGGGGGGGAIGTPPANTVYALPASQFSPSMLTVPVNTSVTVTFFTTTHNVTFDVNAGRPADIPNSTNTSVSRTFATTGSFTYSCTLHPGMTGTVTVTP